MLLRHSKYLATNEIRTGKGKIVMVIMFVPSKWVVIILKSGDFYEAGIHPVLGLPQKNADPECLQTIFTIGTNGVTFF